MEKDLSKFTTEELLEMHAECFVELCKMTANPNTVAMCEQIEKELAARGYR